MTEKEKQEYLVNIYIIAREIDKLCEIEYMASFAQSNVKLKAGISVGI